MEAVVVDAYVADILAMAAQVNCRGKRWIVDPQMQGFWCDLARGWIVRLEPAVQELSMSSDHLIESLALRMVIVAQEGAVREAEGIRPGVRGRRAAPKTARGKAKASKRRRR